MSELNKTLRVAGVGLVLGALAVLTVPGRAVPDAFFDVGETFFLEFTDPESAATLEVVEFDEEQARRYAFSGDKSRWVVEDSVA